MPAGRPTEYEERYNHLAYEHCRIGGKDTDLAALLEVDVSTINVWKNVHPKFQESINDGKLEFDRLRVEGALIHSAIGYSHPSEKIFYDKDGVGIVRAATIEHYPPNPTSLIFWLKNRGKDWKDKQEHEHSGDIIVNINRKPRDSGS